MAESLDVRDFRERLQRLDGLLREADRVADPAARSRVQEIVRAVLDLHGLGLERILELLAEQETGPGAVDAFASDVVVGGLLLLHGLHPLGLEDRVRQALDRVRPYLRSHGGEVELVGLDGGVVRLRLEGSCDGCPSSAVTMKQTVEEAILATAPDAAGVVVENLAPEPVPAGNELRLALPVV